MEVVVVNMPVRRTLYAVTVALSAAATLCAPAQAATRYAAPGATDTTGDCLSTPCRVDRALSVAVDNDTVELGAGTYNVNYPVSAAHLIDVRGVGSVQLVSTAAAPALSMQWGGTLSNVHVYTAVAGQHALDVRQVDVNRVVAEADNGAHAVSLTGALGGTVFRNSVALVRSGAGHAVQITGTGSGRDATLLNVTAISRGGTAINTAGAGAKTIKNTIVRGATDISGLADVSYSNYRPAVATGVTPGAGNQSADPQFTDEAGGDLSPAAGSPTIDAGAADVASGGYDVAGQTRTAGLAIDIGAHERQAVDPPPGPDPDPSSTGSGNPTNGTPPSGTTTTTTTTDPAPEHKTETGGNGATGNTAGGAGSAPPALPPAGDPVIGTSVTLGEVKGAPLVRLPGTGSFVALTADSTVPVGAVVDATRGTIELTSALDRSGVKTQTGTFWGGVFKVAQSRRDGAVELALQGGDFSSCKTGRGGRSARLVAARARYQATIRRLWGRDHGGRFRSRGRNGSATVRGTRWLTEDRCEGTLFKVADGAIDVRDDGTRRTVRVNRGGSYLAKAPKRRR